MRVHVLGIALVVAASGGLAQEKGAPAIKTFASAADVMALQAKARNDRKEGQALVAERILSLAPYNANLEYRTAVAAASVHETEAELFYVLDGSATLVTGGKLKDEKRTNAQNLSGSGIEGGKSEALAKGDVVIVPEGTPHWFSAINGSVTLMSLHMPRPVPAH
jgi:mannose-6-phosphate isomerase-like protein (cupin superfamily)